LLRIQSERLIRICIQSETVVRICFQWETIIRICIQSGTVIRICVQSCTVIIICVQSGTFIIICVQSDTVIRICILSETAIKIYIQSRGGTTRWCRMQIFVCCTTGSRHQYIVIRWEWHYRIFSVLLSRLQRSRMINGEFLSVNCWYISIYEWNLHKNVWVEC
jgi:hypothetical protein